MRRFALISDIHARPDKLEAVAAGIRREGIEEIICLGDIVGYGSHPAPCLAWVREHCSVCVMGNHDAMTVAPGLDLEGFPPEVSEPLETARRELDAESKEWLSDLSLHWQDDLFEVCHANLADPAHFAHMSPGRVPLLLRHFAKQSLDICFFGHTHEARIFHQPRQGVIRDLPATGSIVLDGPGKFSVGIGSVSFSRDHDPRPSWVEFCPAERTMTFHREEECGEPPRKP